MIAASLVALAVGAAPSGAALGIACPDPTSQAFSPWNDLSSYAYVPNGGFEAGAAGWKLTGGAAVVAGNESFSVRGAGDGHSLALPAGGSATSAQMCIGLLSGHMRFFAMNAGDPAARLRVQLVYGGGLGAVLGIADAGTVTAAGGWQPSPEVGMLGGLLPLLTQYVQVRFTSLDSGGDWRIDDVYIDPLMHG